jgi:hypothetical protein
MSYTSGWNGHGGGNNSKPVQQDQTTLRNSDANKSAGGAGGGSKHASHGKSILVVIPAIEELHDVVHGASTDGEEMRLHSMNFLLRSGK